MITNCIVQAGDDAIVVKNSAPMAKKYGACENVVISNCVLYSHDSALKVGTETCHAIRHVVLSDCVFRDCSRGGGIWARDGALIEDIHVHHVSGNTKRYADCPQRKFCTEVVGERENRFSLVQHLEDRENIRDYIRNISFDPYLHDSRVCIVSCRRRRKQN